MVILTTNDIASFPVKENWFKSPEAVAKACRDGVLYGYKSSDPLPSWQIPADSLAYCIRYNPFYEESFSTIKVKELDPEMAKKVKNVKNYMDKKKTLHDEKYSIAVLSGIFGLPRNQIVAMFCADEPIWKRMAYSLPASANSYSHAIPATKVVRYLAENTAWVDKLYERHQMALANGQSVEESLIRHVLMLYNYYKDNGYLI